MSSQHIGLHHAVRGTSIFFNVISYLVFNRSNISEGMLTAFVWPFLRSTILHWGINSLHSSLVAFFQKPHFPLTKFRSINKMHHRQRIVRKCRSKLHLFIDLGRSKNLRSVSLSVTFKPQSMPMQNKRAATLVYNWSYRWEDGRWSFEVRLGLSYPPCAREEFERHFLLFFSCSPCAEEFGRHFLLQFFLFFLGRWVQPPFCLRKIVTQNSPFSLKKKFWRKKFFWGFFLPEVGKPSVEISRENENCQKLEALNITLHLTYIR